MSYLFEFADVATDERRIVRARDAESAIAWVEKNRDGVFDCIAQYREIDPPGDPLVRWERGEP